MATLGFLTVRGSCRSWTSSRVAGFSQNECSKKVSHKLQGMAFAIFYFSKVTSLPRFKGLRSNFHVSMRKCMHTGREQIDAW